METKGLDAILTKDQELQKAKILEELMGERKKEAPKPIEKELKKEPEKEAVAPAKPKEKKPKKPKNDQYKYFKVVEASFEEKPKAVDEKREEKAKEPLNETLESIEMDEAIKEPEKIEGSTTEEAPEINDPIPSQEIELVIKEEAERAEKERAEAEREKLEKEEEMKRKQEALYLELEKSKEEYASKMKSAIEKTVGKSVTQEEAERLESSGNVYRKTILIAREVEEKKEPGRYVLKVRKNEREIPLTGSIYTIGRKKECDISFPDEQYIGRTHAEILIGENITLRDLNSKNGTFVNGKKIDTAILEDGDIITFADVDCILRRV